MHAACGNRNSRSVGPISTTSNMSMIRSKSGDDSNTIERTSISRSRRKKRNNGSSSRRRAGSSSTADLARVGFDGNISHTRSLPVPVVQIGTTPTISSFGIDDKSHGGICNNRRSGIDSSNKRQTQTLALSQSDHNTSTTTTIIALLRRRIVSLEESNSSILERVASLERQVSSKANNNNNNNTSDTILVIDDSTTGPPNNTQQKNNDQKEKKNSMRKKRRNTTTANSNNHDDTKKGEPRSQNKTANNRRDTDRNDQKRGIHGPNYLSTAVRRSSVLFQKLSRKTTETDQDNRSQLSPVLSSSSLSLSSSILMTNELDKKLEKYSETNNVTPAPLAPHETAKKSRRLSTVKWRSVRFFSSEK